jgi:hypothetical protein
MFVATAISRPALMRLPLLLALPGESPECSMIFTATVTAFQRPAQQTAAAHPRQPI